MSKIAELTISQLIKIIIGIVVFVIVVVGIYLFFNNYVIDFFKNIVGDETITEELSSSTDIPEEFGEKQLITNEQCNALCGKGLFSLCDSEECSALGCNYIKTKWYRRDKCLAK